MAPVGQAGRHVASTIGTIHHGPKTPTAGDGAGDRQRLRERGDYSADHSPQATRETEKVVVWRVALAAPSTSTSPATIAQCRWSGPLRLMPPAPPGFFTFRCGNGGRDIRAADARCLFAWGVACGGASMSCAAGRKPAARRGSVGKQCNQGAMRDDRATSLASSRCRFLTELRWASSNLGDGVRTVSSRLAERMFWRGPGATVSRDVFPRGQRHRRMGAAESASPQTRRASRLRESRAANLEKRKESKSGASAAPEALMRP